MENNISDNWIDLSKLPRFEGLTKHKNINWKASPGHEVKFCYNGVNSVAKILSMNAKARKLRIYIDGWTVKDGEDIIIQAFQNCQLHKVYNKISVLAPEIIPYLDNENDAYRFAPYHNGKLPMHCLECGTKKMCSPSNFMKNKLVCEACGDGVSYPNKFMFNLLTQLGIKFIPEVNRSIDGFEWISGGYRYDFYFVIDNAKYLVEMDGHFHNLQKEKCSDKVKDALAEQNNLTLIRIDCKYDKLPFLYIKNNILSGQLADILDLHKIDWEECDRYATGSLLNDVCNMWENKKMSVGEIVKETHFNKSTVREYLMRGVDLGLCPSYNKYESRKRMGITHNKYVACCVDGEIKCVFLNASELDRISVKIGIPRLYNSVIRKACRGELINYHGLNFKDITKEEYEQYKMINNEVVLKEAIV